MLPAIFFGLFAIVVHALDPQVPLGSTHYLYHSTALGDAEDITEWSFEKLPNPNATDHLVFETVNSLLQHWPNTRMRNGHNIVPGIIPKGTLLYHGTPCNELPSHPDWVATDPEHSYLFCFDEFEDSRHGCWHITLTTTRPLKVVYFDGTSAAEFPFGTLDAQDLLLWGKSHPRSPTEEVPRIEDLCKWGKKFGVDGFVRMEMDFEIMLCNFTDGVTVVSFANIVSRGPVPLSLPEFVTFDVTNAGARHNHFPGETRVQLDLTRLVSFYDTQLVPSLVDIRAGQERWDHRVQNISDEDLSTVKSTIEQVLTRPSGPSSGIDWRTLFHVIVDRYAGRLELMRHFLNSSATDQNEMLVLANKTQSQLRMTLNPYILFSAAPTDPSNETNLDWTIPIYELCATTYTKSIELESDSMTDSEKLLLRAVRGTTKEICRVLTKMWAAGVYAGIDSLLNTKESQDIDVSHMWHSWREDLNGLMTWLDWNVWIKCNPACGPEERCYLPTWPFTFPASERVRDPNPRYRKPRCSDPDRPESGEATGIWLQSVVKNDDPWDVYIPDTDDWIRPQPKCVRIVEPYKF